MEVHLYRRPRRPLPGFERSYHVERARIDCAVRKTAEQIFHLERGYFFIWSGATLWLYQPSKLYGTASAPSSFQSVPRNSESPIPIISI